MVTLAGVGAGALASHGQADALLAVSGKSHDDHFVSGSIGIIKGVTKALVDAPAGVSGANPSLFEAWVLIGVANGATVSPTSGWTSASRGGSAGARSCSCSRPPACWRRHGGRGGGGGWGWGHWAALLFQRGWNVLQGEDPAQLHCACWTSIQAKWPLTPFQTFVLWGILVLVAASVTIYQTIIM